MKMHFDKFITNNNWLCAQFGKSFFLFTCEKKGQFIHKFLRITFVEGMHVQTNLTVGGYEEC